MQRRFISIWFCNLATDWMVRRNPALKDIPFVLAAPDHGKMKVTVANLLAQQDGIYKGMALADARTINHTLLHFNDEPNREIKLLTGLAEWFIRFTPSVAVDNNDGLLLDVTGCAHLWGGEKKYLTDMHNRLQHFGYRHKFGMADTIGAAWAVARFGKDKCIVENGEHAAALLPLPATALRLETPITERLNKLGIGQIKNFIHMPRTALRRRFGKELLQQLDKAMGSEEETIQSIIPAELFYERLPCMEPIATRRGIEIALERLLDAMCNRFVKEEKGLRKAILKCYRVDGKIETIEIGTNHPSCNSKHLYKLFEDKIATITPALGIELFVLEAPVVEELSTLQKKLFISNHGVDDIGLAELLDRIGGKIGGQNIHRYLPDAHYWPERSFKETTNIHEKITTDWKMEKPRPLQLLKHPVTIEVTAPVPDYPPMNFRYKGKLHNIKKADGPERIEQEWWLQDGQHRDYYSVEDEEGSRYWLFRLGHYDVKKTYGWFLHGFFA